MPKQSETSRQRVTGSERRREAVRLRMLGQHYDEIAAALGISKQAAHALVKSALAANAAETAGMIDELRALEDERLDVRQRRAMAALAKVELEDTGGLNQVDQVLDRIARRRAALWGLDMPARALVPGGAEGVVAIEVVSGATGGDAENGAG